MTAPSVDAALALIADRLPGWDYHIAYNARSGMHMVAMWRGDDLGHKGASKSLARALLAATLEAIAKEQQP
jgi:hypothetical protein